MAFHKIPLMEQQLESIKTPVKTPIEILKQYYGYTGFRPGQEEVIGSVLGGRDALAVMPTGAGKSVCFQIPALIFGGITLVISPLISLMRDQVAALTQNGVAAAFINSSLTQAQTEKAISRARQGLYKIIYVAPERLDAPSFAGFVQEADISMVAVDEAHCVSHWGQDFRPSYLNISAFVASLRRRPVLTAFTATATGEVKDDIVRLLGLNDPLVMTTGFDRGNLFFEVRQPRDKYGELVSYLRLALAGNAHKSGIVYCATRKTVDEVSYRLICDGFLACAYHAGMTKDGRIAAQDDFVYDRKNVIVATNAFGMGIDKSDVSFVIHYNMPKNVESYYQEAGRAGRDGSPADCILFFSAQDIIINRFLIEHTDADNPLPPEELRAAKLRDYKRLKQMERYCKTAECLRRFILDYFGDYEDIGCDNCGNCRAERRTADITIDAQKILSCVYRMGGRFGAAAVTDVLRGARTEKIARAGLDAIKTFGAMADKSACEIREAVDFLLQSGYLRASEGEYPVVSVSDRAGAVLFHGEKVFMPVFDRAPGKEARAPGGRPLNKSADRLYARRAAVDAALLEALKALRLKIARDENVPAFVIFSDATLVDMCLRLPLDERAFLDVSGVGQVKFGKYGAAFLNVLRGFKSPGGGDNVKDTRGYANERPAFDADAFGGEYYRKLADKLYAQRAAAVAAPPEAGGARNTDASAGVAGAGPRDTARFVEENFEFSDEPVTISKFLDSVNALVYQRRGRRIALRRVTGRLIEEGYLADTEIDGQKARAATEKGKAAGIRTVRQENAGGEAYYLNYYSAGAQRLLLGFVIAFLEAEV